MWWLFDDHLPGFPGFSAGKPVKMEGRVNSAQAFRDFHPGYGANPGRCGGLDADYEIAERVLAISRMPLRILAFMAGRATRYPEA